MTDDDLPVFCRNKIDIEGNIFFTFGFWYYVLVGLKVINLS